MDSLGLECADWNSDPSASTLSSSTRRSKKGSTKQDDDVAMNDTEDNQDKRASSGRRSRFDGVPSGDSEGEGDQRDLDDDDDEEEDDPFGGGFLGGPGGPPAGLSSTLRALSGMMSGVSTRLRDILNNLRQKDDPSIQLIALQELSEILLVSTEDNLSGHFSPDQFIKELVTLMQPSQLGEENPEMMLLACRCIANLMEALPASTANVVYGGAVPILCQKLLEIQFIDLAEQALSVRFHAADNESVLTPLLDFREDLCRVSSFHCSGGWSHCMPNLLGFLRHEYAEDSGHDGCELLPKHPRRLVPRDPGRHADPTQCSEQQ